MRRKRGGGQVSREARKEPWVRSAITLFGFQRAGGAPGLREAIGLSNEDCAKREECEQSTVAGLQLPAN